MASARLDKFNFSEQNEKDSYLYKNRIKQPRLRCKKCHKVKNNFIQRKPEIIKRLSRTCFEHP